MTGAILIISLSAVTVLWLVLEWRTLADDIPGNHITAVVRRAVKSQPGPFLLFMFALGFLCGHLFWP
jgi:hypothetical protein